MSQQKSQNSKQSKQSKYTINIQTIDYYLKKELCCVNLMLLLPRVPVDNVCYL